LKKNRQKTLAIKKAKKTDQKVHEYDGHEEEKDEENDADVDVERRQLVLEENIIELNLTEGHHDDVQDHRVVLEHFLHNRPAPTATKGKRWRYSS